VSCLPDTGCTQTIISADVGRQLRVNINNNRPIELYAANGTKMNVLGSAELIMNSGVSSAHTEVIVVEDVTLPVLVSWHDLQKVSIIPPSFPAATSFAVSGLTAYSLRMSKLEQYPNVFSDQLGLEPMAGGPVAVHLKPNAIPYRVSVARQTPLRFQAPADEAILELLKKGVVAKCEEPTEWCSPAFFVVKADGKSVRMVTDFTKLNKYVDRPAHPFPSVMDILRSIPASARYFAKFDAVNGYFQIALDDASSRLTTFILPSGRYRYLRLPQGLNASSDEWCRRSDAIVDGLQYARKIVDDILLWASSLEELADRIDVIATRSAGLNVILSKKKFAIDETMPFAGYVVSSKGVSPDPARIESLQKFPTPTNATAVRSFLGLANQVSFFIPDYAHVTSAMRALLGQGKVFNWLPEHKFEFETVKTILCKNLLNRHFDPNKSVILMTDASRLYGIGFALCQYLDDEESKTPVIITCGSRSLSDCEKRYATIELECLAIVYAVRKCEFYLKGLPTFSVATDHKPLVGVFNKTIYDLPNPRLQRMREKLGGYSFSVDWIPGKIHYIADALSRAPYFSPEEESDMQVDTALSCLTSTQDPAMKILQVCIDKDYADFCRDVQQGTNFSAYAKSMKNVFDRLSVDGAFVMLDGSRIVVPKSAVKDVLARLHSGHPGQEKTMKLCQVLFYWPGMTNDIRTYIESCQACFRQLPSQQTNPMSTAPPSSSFGPPMAQVGLDLFDCGGHKYLLCVDRWSGYPVYKMLRTLTTNAIVSILEEWFNLFGWPSHIRSDGGPQFGAQFKLWCDEKNISHELSAPYNPKSNGLAESGVKIVKNIILKCIETGEDPRRALYEWRNVPRLDGFSPAQLMFGRRQFTSVPAHSSAFSPIDVNQAMEAKDKVFKSASGYHNFQTGFLPELPSGVKAIAQHPKTGLWSEECTIIRKRPDQLSYDVDFGGRSAIRSRKMLRVKKGDISQSSSAMRAASSSHSSPSPPDAQSSPASSNCPGPSADSGHSPGTLSPGSASHPPHPVKTKTPAASVARVSFVSDRKVDLIGDLRRPVQEGRRPRWEANRRRPQINRPTSRRPTTTGSWTRTTMPSSSSTGPASGEGRQLSSSASPSPSPSSAAGGTIVGQTGSSGKRSSMRWSPSRGKGDLEVSQAPTSIPASLACIREQARRASISLSHPAPQAPSRYSVVGGMAGPRPLSSRPRLPSMEAQADWEATGPLWPGRLEFLKSGSQGVTPLPGSQGSCFGP